MQQTDFQKAEAEMVHNYDSMQIEAIDRAKVYEALHCLLDTLSPLESKVIKLRFGFTWGRVHNYNEVASIIKADVESVMRIEERALNKLKSNKNKIPN